MSASNHPYFYLMYDHLLLFYRHMFRGSTIKSLAREIFIDVGHSLKQRRQDDLRHDFGCHLTDDLWYAFCCFKFPFINLNYFNSYTLCAEVLPKDLNINNFFWKVYSRAF